MSARIVFHSLTHARAVLAAAAEALDLLDVADAGAACRDYLSR